MKCFLFLVAQISKHRLIKNLKSNNWKIHTEKFLKLSQINNN